MKLKIVYTILIVSLFFVCCYVIFGNGDDAEPDFMTEPDFMSAPEEHWIYGRIQYLHDLLSPGLYFMQLLIHPDHPDAKTIDGYVSMDGHAIVKLRDVDVPRALHTTEERFRPHGWRDQERLNWDKAMAYVWNLTELTHTFRVHNLKIIKVDLPMLDVTHVIEADIAYFAGGNWHNLAYSMLSDEHVRPLQADGTLWDPGSKEYSLEHPNLPR